VQTEYAATLAAITGIARIILQIVHYAITRPKKAAASASAARQPSFKTVRSTGQLSIAVSEGCGSGVSLCGRTNLTDVPTGRLFAKYHQPENGFVSCFRPRK